MIFNSYDVKYISSVLDAPHVHGPKARRKFYLLILPIMEVEAGGVEPPSEKRYGPKTTCLSHSIWFASGAWNAQDALPTSPINLAGKPRTEVRRPAYCVTPRSQPVGEAGGNGLR